MTGEEFTFTHGIYRCACLIRAGRQGRLNLLLIGCCWCWQACTHGTAAGRQRLLLGERNAIGQTSPLLARPKQVDSVLKWHDVSEWYASLILIGVSSSSFSSFLLFLLLCRVILLQAHASNLSDTWSPQPNLCLKKRQEKDFHGQLQLKRRIYRVLRATTPSSGYL